MGPVLKGSTKNAATRWGSLPQRMRIMYVTTYQRTGGWLAEALASDSASETILEEALGFAAGLARLRDDVFDAVLIGHEPGELDALAFIEALRSTGSEEPLVVLGEQDETDMTPLCLEANADAYLCVRNTTTRTLIWVVARAIERHTLLRENRRLAEANRHRLDLEQEDVERLLADERALARDLDRLAAARASLGSTDDTDLAPPRRVPLPPQLESHYRELLRAYVMMGQGNLATEMRAVAHLLAAAGVSAAQALDLHIHVVKGLLQGLGNRSGRHVMNRAGLLTLEIAAHLCEVYREQATAAGR